MNIELMDDAELLEHVAFLRDSLNEALAEQRVRTYNRRKTPLFEFMDATSRTSDKSHD
jgi:hypothetical protein